MARSKSIRFAGPTALTGQALPITIRAAPPAHTENDSRRRSLHPRLRRQDSSIQDEDGFMTALPSHGEYIETRVASQPSSYRRLRKSKSMFNTGLLSNVHISSASRNSTQYKSKNTDQQAGSRIGRSLSFLRPSIERTPSQATISTAVQSEAVGLAREQYLRQIEQQRLNNQPSSKNVPNHRRSQKSFRKSVRTSSGNSSSGALGSPTFSVGPQRELKGIGGRARVLSFTLKDRFKRVFNRSLEEGGAFPAQQLRATRQHFGDPAAPYAPPNPPYPPTKSPHESTLVSTNRERCDSLHIPRRRSSLVGSVRTAGGDPNDETTQSRVTSWTNSTAANTVSSHHGPSSKRLSIIQETGGLPLQHGSSQQAVTGSNSQPRKTSLYAKLQQRMAKSNSIPQSHPPHDDAGVLSDRLDTSAEITSSKSGNISEALGRRPSDHDGPEPQSSVAPKHTSSGNIQQHEPILQKAPPVRTEKLQVDAKELSPKRPLRESKSMFFPQSTRIERTRTSPFRQAMHSSGQPDQKHGTDVTSGPLDRVGKPPYLLASTGIRDRSLTRSESIYSRTSSGDTPELLESSTSLANIETGLDRYLATIPPEVKLEDRLPPFTAEAKQAKEIGHRREHAEISGSDTDLGRLHVLTPMLRDSLVRPRVGVDIRPAPSHTLSQPMIERFPLMSINPQSNTNNAPQKPVDNARIVTASTRENENRPPNSRPEKSMENSSSRRHGPSIPSSQIPFKEAVIQHSASKNDMTGLYVTPVRASPLTALAPTSHSRSSPERIARLRRMQSHYTTGSPNSRKNTGTPFRPRQLTHEHSNQENRDPMRIQSAQRGSSPGEPTAPGLGGRKMVDLFLSNRRDSPIDRGEDVVFI
ncbi:MAG: hypothetical protein Q9213_002631 [Squamulea squamosa]